jgi:hypothetical protein
MEQLVDAGEAMVLETIKLTRRALLQRASGVDLTFATR